MTITAEPIETHASPAQPTVPARTVPRWMVRTADGGFVALVVAAGVMVRHGTAPTVRLPVVLLAMLSCPGYPIVRAARVAPGSDTPALSIAASMALTALIGTVEAKTGHWHPQGTATVVAVVALMLLASAYLPWGAPPQPLRPTLGTESPVAGTARGPRVPSAQSRWLAASLGLTVLICTGLWLVAVAHTNVTDMGSWGLLPRLSVYWYAGLGITTVACLLSQELLGKARIPLSLCCIGLLLLYLYATAPAVEGAPRYSWVYKHIGVVRYILAHHATHNVDIYQRWPAMFSVSAIFGTLSGRFDPVSYAAWGEPFFTALDLVVLYPLAKRFTSDRGAWMACYFFVATNWVGEQYFSPQAFAYVLSLAMILLATGLLDGPIRHWPHRLVGARVGVAVRAPVRVRAAALSLRSLRVQWGYAVPMFILLDAAIVVTHQLTPYIMLVEFAMLAACGLLRPGWLVVALTVIAVGYLIPNLGYVQDNFGLFTSLDPFNNATAQLGGTHPIATLRHIAYFATALTGLIWLIGVAGMAVELRHRPSRRAVVVVATVFVAPFLTLFAQSYGGEARLRIVLFSLPGAAIGAAWLWRRCRGRIARAVVGVLLVPLPTALFIVSAFGNEDLSYIPPGEVAAANWLYAHAKENQVLVFVDSEFPGGIGKNYPAFPSPTGGQFSADLQDSPQFESRDFDTRPVTIEDVVGAMRDLSSRSYLTFARSEANYARDYGVVGGLRGYQDIENMVRTSANFRLVYRNPDAAVYQLQ